jgi:hypothetical protein
MIDTHEPARRKERVVQLLLAPGIAALLGGLVRLRVLAVDRLSLGRGNARACRASTAAQIALACSPKRQRMVDCPLQGDKLLLCHIRLYVGELAGSLAACSGLGKSMGTCPSHPSVIHIRSSNMSVIRPPVSPAARASGNS